MNVAQPRSILLVGGQPTGFLDDYLHQKAVLGQECSISYIDLDNIDSLENLNKRFDAGIAIDLFEHIDKQQGAQILSRLRDVLTAQYCICLPLDAANNSSAWHLTDLFSFALRRVASYHLEGTEYSLFKYSIDNYKKTPDWLNSDNWANPEMWGKYWW